MTRLVIVDDHEALREGLTVLLGGHGMDVVGAADNCAAGLDLVEHSEPDVALVDTRLPDGSGIELTRELHDRRPALRVILYTADSDSGLVVDAIASGANGYALKAGSMAELVGAIECVAAGGSYIDPRLVRILSSSLATAQVPQLSPREREIMHLMAEGWTADQIATELWRDRCRRLWRWLRHWLRR